MGKGLGIAGLVLAIIGIFIPVIGIFVGWAALVLVTIAALAGEKPFTIAVVAISVVNYLFLSPSMWISTAAANLNSGGAPPNILVVITVICVLAPIGGFILYGTGKIMLKQ